MPNELNSVYRNVAVVATPVLVSPDARFLAAWNLINPNTSGVFLKLYDAATAGAVTVGTTAVKSTLFIPGSGTSVLANLENYQLGFQDGIVVAVTTGIADSDTTAPSTGAYVEIQYNLRNT